jgi:Leucine Rich Repeat (LRR) protein
MTKSLLALILIGSSFTSVQCHAGEAHGVSQQERQALIALFEATDGSHWKHHEGWLSGPGTECRWDGVSCKHGVLEPTTTTVTALQLFENNLSGKIPEAVGQLANLEELYISGNKLSGLLPDSLLRRWRNGELFVAAEPSLLTDVTEIDYEFSASALLCAQHRIVLRSDRIAQIFTKRCRNATRDDRTTFCELKEGQIWQGEFEKLGWLLEKNGFFTLASNYERNITDGVFASARVTRSGKAYEVIDYAGAGPFELWVIQLTIEGIASSATDWHKATTRPECPKWRRVKEN